ncbi:MAG: hypothetical protein GX638_05465 [Crenarchaeota archaeon]|nr:hypothetical protein [Thermoproteota archaeon]
MQLQTDIFLTMQSMKQWERVLLHLEKYGKITNMQCHELYGIRHAPSVIRVLRQKGYKIINERKQGINRFGDKVFYDEYIIT